MDGFFPGYWHGFDAREMAWIIEHSYWRTMMNRFYSGFCTLMLTAMPVSVYAESEGASLDADAAEKACLEAAQKKYNAAADDVTRRKAPVKWNSGLDGFSVELAVKKENGKSARFICVAKPNGDFKFYND